MPPKKALLQLLEQRRTEFAPYTSAEKPFWLTSSKVKRQLERRDIVASVKYSETKEARSSPLVLQSAKSDVQQKLIVQAVGRVHAPFHFVWQTVREYDKLPQVSSYFKESRFNTESGRLFLQMEAFKYVAAMVLQTLEKSNEAESSDSGKAFIHWLVVGGSFQGMKGRISIRKIRWDQTEVSIEALYQGRPVPLPQVLVKFGLEFACQKVAQWMRDFIEKQWKERLATSEASV